MNLELSAEQLELRATLRRWAAAEGSIERQVRPVLDGATWRPDAAWAALVGMGLTAPLDAVDAALVAEELGRVLHPGPWVATATAAMALGELDVPAAVATTGALQVERGRVSGTLHRVLGAPLAEVLVAPAGDGVVAVELAAPGVHVEPDPSVDPTTSEGTIALDAAPCRPVEGRLDLDHLLVLRAADALGAAQAVLDLAVEHAKARHQFDRPIGAFQAVAHLLVDALETVELLRGGVLHAAWAAGEERAVAVGRLLAFADRVVTVADTAIQVFGGIGYTWEHDAHLYLRRLLSWSTVRGAASTHRIALGRQLVEGTA